jgi:hypothetical protein
LIDKFQEPQAGLFFFGLLCSTGILSEKFDGSQGRRRERGIKFVKITIQPYSSMIFLRFFIRDGVA